MSDSVRPSIPRPGFRSSAPPPMRERLATLVVDDDDIVGISVAPMFAPKTERPRSVAPPPPPPKAPSVAPASASIPPPPASYVAARGTRATQTAFPPPPSTRARGSAPPPRIATYIPPPAMLAPVAIPAPAPVPVIATPEPRSPVVSILRLSVADPTEAVFDGIYSLSFARSWGEAATMCAETLAKALKARSVIIHSHDLSSGELRAIAAYGDGDFDILGSSERSDDDLVASAVLVNQKPITMRFDGELPGIAPKRLHHVGAPRTVVAAPAIAWGRCLAIVEVIDADERFAARVADAATYVADHLAQFLSAHAA